MSLHLSWLTLFGLWMILLSGFFADFLGSPGIIQKIRLNRLLESQKKELIELQKEVETLKTDQHLLENSRIAQEREIRRTLGYASHDELIFDFSALDPLSDS